MNNKTKLKLLLSLALLGTPAIAQTPTTIEKKYEARARNFAKFLLNWSDIEAYEAVSNRDKRRAEHATYDSAKAKIPELVRDSTILADQITKGANIINKKYDLDEHPDHIYTWYEFFYIYEQRDADKNSEDYIMADILQKYTNVLKQLKLARYTMELNGK